MCACRQLATAASACLQSVLPAAASNPLPPPPAHPPPTHRRPAVEDTCDVIPPPVAVPDAFTMQEGATLVVDGDSLSFLVANDM